MRVSLVAVGILRSAQNDMVVMIYFICFHLSTWLIIYAVQSNGDDEDAIADDANRLS
jgi:hypothetical protein